MFHSLAFLYRQKTYGTAVLRGSMDCAMPFTSDGVLVVQKLSKAASMDTGARI